MSGESNWSHSTAGETRLEKQMETKKRHILGRLRFTARVVAILGGLSTSFPS